MHHGTMATAAWSLLVAAANAQTIKYFGFKVAECPHEGGKQNLVHICILSLNLVIHNAT